jgi:hypothetical protein
MSDQVSRRKPSNPVAAGIAGALLGGASGALIGYSFAGSDGIPVGALLGALYFGLVEAITDVRRKPAALKPLWHRLIGTTIVGAAVAVILSFIIDNVLLLSLVMGLLVGLIGLGLRKLLLGLALGLAVGLLAGLASADPNAAIVGGSVALLYRLLLLLFFREQAPLQFTGERVPAGEARYVVPFEARTKYIGAEYMANLARDSEGSFKRNQPNIGIVESFDSLRGPTFDPARVAPLIREFYEHTSRFKLSIEPKWNPFMKPFFWLFKNTVAQPIGQANLPFNMEEAQRGMVSYIDTIDYGPASDGDKGADDGTAEHIETLRGWIRAYEDSGEAIYVGIYTVVRYEGLGYVSVGFPLPEANFTATLKPFNNRGDGLLLKTHATGSDFTGHYLTDIDNEDGALTILKLPTMGEEIDVYVQNGQLKTDHRFYFGRNNFLTLYYSMERISSGSLLRG